MNVATRVESLAVPGATYVTEETFKLAEGLFQFEALGEKEVKEDGKFAIKHLLNCIKYSEEVKFVALLACSWAYLGHAYSYVGDLETGRRYVEKGLKIPREGAFESLLSHLSI